MQKCYDIDLHYIISDCFVTGEASVPSICIRCLLGYMLDYRGCLVGPTNVLYNVV